MAPAIEYAEKGYPIDQMLAQSIDRGKNNLGKYPTTAKIFLPNGQPLKAGELLKNPDYAATLRKLVDAEKQALAKKATRSAAIKAAFDRFYKGDIAQEFERFFKENGGILTAADLAGYEPQWTEPLRTTYRGYDVFSNPSTSRGGFEVLMGANLVERFDLASYGSGSPQAMHALIEAIKVSKADIYRYVADPKFTVIPTAGMLSKPYAASRSALIDMSKAAGYPEAGAPEGRTNTSAQQASLSRQGYGGPRHSPSTTTANSTPRASRSSTSSATPSASRRRSAASSATTWWWARRGCCSTTACGWVRRRRIPTTSTTLAPGRCRS